MREASQLFAAMAAVLHVLIFCMESVWFTRPGMYRRFGVATASDAQACRRWAFNQGFYNLFLALGVLVGLWLLHAGGMVATGWALVLFGCACMLGAGVVLFISGGRAMRRAAVIQAAFPLLAWLAWLVA